jgi:hypothetical protein
VRAENNALPIDLCRLNHLHRLINDQSVFRLSPDRYRDEDDIYRTTDALALECLAGGKDRLRSKNSKPSSCIFSPAQCHYRWETAFKFLPTRSTFLAIVKKPPSAGIRNSGLRVS